MTTSRFRLHVRNFGPIGEAELELRPLTVLVGPSNTGKSYLAGLLYALHRAFRPAQVLGHALVGQQDWQTRSTDEQLRRTAASWLSAVADDSESHAPIPAALATHIHEVLNESADFGPVLVGEVARCFGVGDAATLVRHGSRAATPSLDVFVSHGTKGESRFRAELGSDASSTDVDVRVAGFQIPDHHMRWFLDAARVVDDDRRGGGLVGALAESVFGWAFDPLVRHSAHYLPADRTGVMHIHHVLVSALLQRASFPERHFNDMPVLPGMLADFLGTLVSRISQVGSHPRVEAARELAEGIERRILGGHVALNLGEVGYPAFSYRPDGWQRDLPLMQASSMVSELAPVVLYLRHVVRRGDLLIIDEPESHLHPAKQTAFARELAAIANAGVRVVMTTHSEWFLEQIGNLARASELPPDKRSSAAEVLQPEDVGAWLFQDAGDGKGSSVSEIKLDPETGLFPTDFGPVSDALYNEHAAIFNALESDADE